MNEMPDSTSAAALHGAAEGATADHQVRWLTAEETDAWVTTAGMLVKLPALLDAQLQRDSGITLFEYFVLSWLSMSPARTARMSELAELTSASLSRLSNVVRKLEEHGWVQRCPDESDRRYTRARLTDEGYQVVAAAALGHVEAVRRFLIDPLSATQLHALGEIGRTIGGCIGVRRAANVELPCEDGESSC
jgi:DNA-binding MarR family transcriptional regulator